VSLRQGSLKNHFLKEFFKAPIKVLQRTFRTWFFKAPFMVPQRTMKVPSGKRVLQSDAIEEPFWVPPRTFQSRIL